MRRVLFFTFLALLGSVPLAHAKTIIISGFDPFDGADGNNSQKMARELVQNLRQKRPADVFKFCQLRTVYDKAAQELLDCVGSSLEEPHFVLGLGETGCGELKWETSAINQDLDYSADNEGVHREGEPIAPGAPERVGLNLPVHKAWCALSERDQNRMSISNDAGTFVCNNTAYRLARNHPHLRFGFAHVPSHNCWWRGRAKYNRAKQTLEKLILKLLDQNFENFGSYPVSKEGAAERLENATACEREFYQRLIKKY